MMSVTGDITALRQEVERLRADLEREREEKTRLLAIVEQVTARQGVDYETPVRVRLKTPEERAAAAVEAEHRIAEARQRAEQEREQRRALKTARVTAARVYFVQQEDGERLVKIGYTTRTVDQRLRELQAGHRSPLSVLTSAPGGRRQEQDLHFRFAGLRVSGEWFRPGQELMSYIALVAAGGVL